MSQRGNQLTVAAGTRKGRRRRRSERKGVTLERRRRWRRDDSPRRIPRPRGWSVNDDGPSRKLSKRVTSDAYAFATSGWPGCINSNSILRYAAAACKSDVGWARVEWTSLPRVCQRYSSTRLSTYRSAMSANMSQQSQVQINNLASLHIKESWTRGRRVGTESSFYGCALLQPNL